MSRKSDKHSDTLDFFGDLEPEPLRSSKLPGTQRKQEPISGKSTTQRPVLKDAVALPPAQESYLTDKQVAKRFSVCRQTVWRWVEAGTFPKAKKLSSKVTRWRLSDLLAYETSLTTRSKPKGTAPGGRQIAKKERQP
ncbi:helix-turn-helix domain-containing protein [Parasedimentitalea maritima]|uniref:Helix-turn-helix domain-containing protein n=2 Tax=Parasedimentitalea maritima TaxID=2578117 RepID=A0ABY2UQX8_9RHOB|nr:helix-turn-helix domain-containing protein [Zongyanglinia marina]TLP55348.1 helix-turn-helix domain-containing protein [Zongyanglinia marina]